MMTVQMPRRRALSKSANVVAVTAVESKEIAAPSDRFLAFLKKSFKSADLDAVRADIAGQVRVSLPVVEEEAAED